MSRIHKYAELTLTELQAINPEKAICLMAVSPLEVHGPHLPLGTDVFVGEKLQSEYCSALSMLYPDLDLLILPPIFAGCDPIPVKGSVAIRARTLEGLLWDYVRSLAGQGIKYLIICDNHGGPSHQIAMEIVARRAWRRLGFAVINPFNVVFKKMIQHDRAFYELVNLLPGEGGDDGDCHAGTNETSLVLAANKGLVKEYRGVTASPPPKRQGIAAILGGLGNLCGMLGLKKHKSDLDHLANLLAWVNSPNMLPYLGAPGMASAEAGHRMIRGHVAVAMELVEVALAGKRPFTQPMLWWIRAFRR